MIMTNLMAAACIVAAAALVLRATLLGRQGQGWPNASRGVRWATELFGLAAFLRGVELVALGKPASLGETGFAAAVLIYAAVMLCWCGRPLIPTV